jgi:hypothetical protein
MWLILWLERCSLLRGFFKGSSRQPNYCNATDVFVSFAKQNRFPDAKKLPRTMASEIAEKVDGSQQNVSDENCTALAERVNAAASR